MPDLFLELHADVIAEAAASFDGHVTHGSLDALLKCFDELIKKRLGIVFDVINAMAEADILSGNPIAGAHHRAIEKYRESLK